MTSHVQMREDVRRIVRIGRTDACEQDDLLYFLPNLPTLRGSEFIFKLEWSSIAGHVGPEIVPFIKGLHFIEEAHKDYSLSEFGFGSPCPAWNVLEHLRHAGQQSLDGADLLTEWIRNNGGNFYVKR